MYGTFIDLVLMMVVVETTPRTKSTAIRHFMSSTFTIRKRVIFA